MALQLALNPPGKWNANRKGDRIAFEVNHAAGIFYRSQIESGWWPCLWPVWLKKLTYQVLNYEHISWFNCQRSLGQPNRLYILVQSNTWRCSIFLLSACQKLKVFLFNFFWWPRSLDDLNNNLYNITTVELKDVFLAGLWPAHLEGYVILF